MQTGAFVFYTISSSAVEPFEVVPPQGWHFALHTLLVVGIGAGQHQVAGIDLLQFGILTGYPHPPLVVLLAFVEVDFQTEVFEAHKVVLAT